MCNLLGIWNLNHDQNIAIVATMVTGYWSGRHGKPNHCGWDGMTTGWVVPLYKHEHLSVHTYPHKTIILSPAFPDQHKFDYKLHRKQCGLGTV